jgi:hypothetical protein
MDFAGALAGGGAMITRLDTIRVGPRMVRLVAESDLEAPIYRWWVDGAFYREGRGDWIELPTNVQRRVVVLDQDGGEVPEVAESAAGYRLEWEASRRPEGGELAVRYRVERWTGSAWGTVYEVEASGVRLYTALIEAGDVVEDLKLRVVGVDNAGGELVVFERDGLAVRVPDVPAQVFAVVEGDLIVGGG